MKTGRRRVLYTLCALWLVTAPLLAEGDCYTTGGWQEDVFCFDTLDCVGWGAWWDCLWS